MKKVKTDQQKIFASVLQIGLHFCLFQSDVRQCTKFHRKIVVNKGFLHFGKKIIFLPPKKSQKKLSSPIGMICRFQGNGAILSPLMQSVFPYLGRESRNQP
jgi:hypothetical protein